MPGAKRWRALWPSILSLTFAAKLPNSIAVFGRQALILGGVTRVIGTEPWYLHPASEFSIEEVPALVQNCGGVCYPAHVDREANPA